MPRSKHTRIDEKKVNCLIQKDIQKETITSNNKPIKCLPIMWKTLTTQIIEEIYHLLESFELFPELKKENCSGTSGQMTYYI